MIGNTHGRSEQPHDSRLRSLDDRGISEVLGAILLFALIILLIALIQLNAVPAANQQVEFEHNQRVQGDLQEFQEVFLRSATTNTDGSVAIEAGTSYPSRFFLFNPPDPTGTVSVGDGGQIRLENVYASGEARDYLDGTERQFDTRFLTYTPNYNEYRNPPTTVFENGLLYNEFTNDQRVVSERRSFIDGRTISLVALQGQYSTGTSGSLALETTPISAPGQEVSVSTQTASPTDDPIVIHIPTRLPAEEWEAILEDELQSNGGYVLPITDDTSDGELTIELAPGERYDLRTAAVGVGGQFDTETDPEYIVDVSGNGETVPEGGSQRLVAEVRDAYSNPVSNVEVANTTNLANASVRAVGGSSATGANGRIAVTFEPPNDVDATTNATVTLSFGGNTSERQRVRFKLSVFDADGSGSVTSPSSGGNPINPANVVITDANLVGGQCNNRNGNCVVDLTMENRDGLVGKEIRQMRISFYSTDDDWLAPTSVEVRDEPLAGGTVTTLTIPDNYKSVDLEDLAKAGSTGDTQEYRLSFKNFVKPSPGGGSPQVSNGAITGDFFILEVRFRDKGTTTENYVTYFVGPT